MTLPRSLPIGTVLLLLLAAALFAAATPAAALSDEEVKQELQKFEIPDEDVPQGWTSTASQTGKEAGLVRFIQRFESEDTEMRMDYVAAYDPDRDLYRELSDDTAFEGPEEPSTYDTSGTRLTLENGETVEATLQRVKRDDPNAPVDTVKHIRFFAHRGDFTYVASSDSWVMLEEDVGNPDGLMRELLTAGLNRANGLELATGKFDAERSKTPTRVQDVDRTPTLEGQANEGDSGESPDNQAPGFGPLLTLAGAGLTAYALRRRSGT